MVDRKSYSTHQKIFKLDNVPFGPNEVTLATGYWDLLHAGHVGFLEECRDIGDPLTVGVRAKAKSGKPGKPIVPDQARLTVVAGLACVNYTFLDEYGYSREVLDPIKPKTIIFSGGEEPSPEKKAEVLFIASRYPQLNIRELPRSTDPISTSQIIDWIRRPSRSFEREVLRPEEIENALVAYAAQSNAAFKTAAFVMGEDGAVLAKGVNYHPEFTGTVVYVNPNTLEYKEDKPRPTHAEVDAILNNGEASSDGELHTLHSLHMPCAGCAEFISRNGLIKRIVYYKGFDNNYGELVLRRNGIELINAHEA